MLERNFQARVIRKLKQTYPDCVVLKTDPNYIQGFPDLLVLRGRTWVALECKRDEKAARRPNQEYYVNKLDRMSLARFISPENEKEVFHEIQRTFQAEGGACASQSQRIPLAPL